MSDDDERAADLKERVLQMQKTVDLRRRLEALEFPGVKVETEDKP